MIGELSEQQVEEGDSRYAAIVMLVVATVAIVAAVVLAQLGGPGAQWPAGLGAALVVLGGLGGHRASVGCGVIGIAIGAVVVTYERSVAYMLGVNAAVALACMVILAGTTLSFTTRSQTVASSVTTSGFARSYAVTTLAGIGTATAALAIALNVEWPSWLVLLPAILLAIGAGVLAIWSTRY